MTQVGVKVPRTPLYADRCCRLVARGENGSAWTVVEVWRLSGAGISKGCSLWTAHPFDLFPQWMQRRKMEPEAQVMPKS